MPEDLNPELTETAPETASSAPETVPETVDSADPFDAGSDTFDRAYVEKLRKESANYRTKAQPYEEVFGQYEDDDREIWFEAARRVAADPRQGGEYLKQIAEALLAEQQAEQQSAPDDSDRPLTRAEYQAMREAERVEQEQQAEISRIEKTAADLGYDIESHHYTTLLTVASRLPSGSIEEAHAVLEAEKQAYRDKVIAELQAEAEEAPTAPSTGAGAQPSGERRLKTWADADRAARARLEAEQVAGTGRRGRG